MLFSNCRNRGYSLVKVHRLLIVVASFVEEALGHRGSVAAAPGL